MSNMVKVAEAANELHISLNRVYTLIRKGKFKNVEKKHREMLIDLDEMKTLYPCDNNQYPDDTWITGTKAISEFHLGQGTLTKYKKEGVIKTKYGVSPKNNGRILLYNVEDLKNLDIRKQKGHKTRRSSNAIDFSNGEVEFIEKLVETRFHGYTQMAIYIFENYKIPRITSHVSITHDLRMHSSIEPRYEIIRQCLRDLGYSETTTEPIVVEITKPIGPEGMNNRDLFNFYNELNDSQKLYFNMLIELEAFRRQEEKKYSKPKDEKKNPRS